MNKSSFVVWRANFLTGLALVTPAVISIALLVWIFGTIANITDALLFFMPRDITHESGLNGPGTGPMHWYWSLVALVVAVGLVTLLGFAARHYLGQQLIAAGERALLHIPLLNKIYSVIKQVNDAFASGKKNSLKTVVLVEFPRPGCYAIGFLTSDRNDEVQAKMQTRVVCVFIPTTPNPTSGFLILVPESQVTRLQMSVAEGIKYIISLGAVSPDYPPASVVTPTPLPG